MIIYSAIAFVCAVFFIISLVLDIDPDTDADEILSIKSLMFFGMGFGSVGTVFSFYEFQQIITASAGIISGFLLAGLGVGLLRLFKKQEATTTQNLQNIIGHPGLIVLDITSSSVPGMIQTTDEFGRSIYLTAFSVDNSPMRVGKRIQIIGIHGQSALVKGV